MPDGSTLVHLLFSPIRSAPIALLGGLLAAGCSPAARPDATPPARAPAGAPAGAEPRADDASGDAAAGAAVPIFRLPSDVRPTRQRVELEVVPDRDVFSGRVEIALQLDKPRDDLWISARDLTLTDGALRVGGEALPLRFEQDDARGATRLVLPRRAAAGTATLSLGFRGPFNPKLVGLYRVKAGDRWYAYTQFEAIDARRAFPCFDEPAFKIPWEIVLTVPAQLVAVSNTSAVEETRAGELKRVRFAATRPLPSYLVALAVGDFDVVTPPPMPPNEVRARPLQVRGLAPKGRGAELSYSLQIAAELLVLLERWFGTEFPYEKLDHIAVPDFQYGAMENAGLITYREQLLLVDPKTASEEQKQVVGVVIAHEMAHHWFGDLVTMSWWDDLWLNESFAAVMETEIAGAWAPAHRFDLIRQRAVHAAMLTDELPSVRPIRPSLRVEGDIFGFDYRIAYDKGQSVIAMFAQFLGKDDFRAGIRRYLAAHVDGNATRDDLIAALSAEGTDVGAGMRSFIDQPGIPLIQANLLCGPGGPRVALAQSRHLPLGAKVAGEARWAVPVCVRAQGASKPDCMLLDQVSAELPLAQKSCPAWIALNADARGYYRWTLPSDQLRALLDRGYTRLTSAERAALANNLQAGFRSGALAAGDVLAALGPLARDKEPAVAEEPGRLLARVRDHIVEPSQRGAVEAHMQSLYRPVLARLGWKSKPGEPSRIQIFRRWTIEFLAITAQDRKVLERAAALGRAYIGSGPAGRLHPEAVDRNLASVAVRAAGRLGSKELFETMIERLSGERDSNAREYLLAGLAAFSDPELAARARDLAFDERLRTNERVTIIALQIQSPEQRPAAWAWVKQNFDRFAPLLPPSYVQFLSQVPSGCTEEAAIDLEQTLGERMARYPGGPYTLAKALEETRLCAALAAAQRKGATDFFAAQSKGTPVASAGAPR